MKANVSEQARIPGHGLPSCTAGQGFFTRFETDALATPLQTEKGNAGVHAECQFAKVSDVLIVGVDAAAFQENDRKSVTILGQPIWRRTSVLAISPDERGDNVRHAKGQR